MKTASYCLVVPACLSRIQNIGYELGENGRTPEWYRAHHRTPWVAGGMVDIWHVSENAPNLTPECRLGWGVMAADSAVGLAHCTGGIVAPVMFWPP